MLRIDALRIYEYVQENFGELLERLNLQMAEPNVFAEEIEIKERHAGCRYSPYGIFIEYMEGQGYCNRDRFFTYKAQDVLSFMMSVEHRFLNGFLNHQLKECMDDFAEEMKFNKIIKE